jgi:hypothetical protein
MHKGMTLRCVGEERALDFGQALQMIDATLKLAGVDTNRLKQKPSQTRKSLRSALRLRRIADTRCGATSLCSGMTILQPAQFAASGTITYETRVVEVSGVLDILGTEEKMQH